MASPRRIDPSLKKIANKQPGKEIAAYFNINNSHPSFSFHQYPCSNEKGNVRHIAFEQDIKKWLENSQLEIMNIYANLGMVTVRGQACMIIHWAHKDEVARAKKTGQD